MSALDIAKPIGGRLIISSDALQELGQLEAIKKLEEVQRECQRRGLMVEFDPANRAWVITGETISG